MQEFLGRYRVVRTLGEGGMGRVYLAEMAGPSGFHRRVVVKVVRDADKAGLEEALLEEARLTASLVHRNIVPVLGLEDAGGEKIVVLEYVDGLDLRNLLDEKHKLPWTLATYIATEVALGLDYAHRHSDPSGRPIGIVHRDVSPANILLSWEGEVKLTDFGVAKRRGPDGRSAQSLDGVKGNVSYMAPEQARGERVDARSDIFALGVVLFEAVSGDNPFRGRTQLETLANVREHTLPRIRTDIPLELADVIQRSTARDPNERFQTAAELRQALIRIPGLPVDPSSELGEFLREHRRIVSTGGHDALYQAVLGGGGRPLTRLALKTVHKLKAQSNRLFWIGGAALICLLAAGGYFQYARRAAARTAVKMSPASHAPIAVAHRPSPETASASETVPTTEATPENEPAKPRKETCLLSLRSQPAGALARVTPEKGAPLKGKTPVELKLPCGGDPIKVSLRARGFAEWKETVVLDDDHAFDASLEKRGNISVNAIPWAQIFLDGKPVGHTPRKHVVLDPGRHHLKLVTSKGDVRMRTVEVAPGRETKVTVVFADP